MKKMINNASDFVDETIEGIIAAYGDYLKLNNGDKREIITNYPVKEKKVGISPTSSTRNFFLPFSF